LKSTHVYIVSLCALWSLFTQTPLLAQGTLSGSQICERCQKAYNALKSYQGTTKVTTNSSLGGGTQVFHSSADIKFSRPSLLKVDGTLISSGPYSLVSDGKTTWTSWMLTKGKWQKQASLDMAIAGLTGISGQSCTTIPAMLVHTQFGSPFGAGAQIDSKVGQETVNGKATFRVNVTDASGDRTIWIDRKTFLLVKMLTAVKLTKKGAAKSANSPNPVGTDIVQEFVSVKPNAAISPTVFAQPKGN
jgi:hypothetical protein